MVNSTSGKRSDHVLKLLGTVSCKMLSAPALEEGVVKTMVGEITVIYSIVMTRLGRLDRITKRRARGRDRYHVRSLLDAVGVKASRPPSLLLLLLLCMKMGEALLFGRNKSFGRLCVLKFLRIGVEL